jgi:hypothetical protein
VLSLALDQVRVDRSGEARVVQLEADELAAASAGACPACADLDLADERPVVRRGFAALLDRSDRDLGLEADGLDATGEAGVGLREGADGLPCLSLLSLISAAPIAASTEVAEPARSRPHPQGRNEEEETRRAPLAAFRRRVG